MTRNMINLFAGAGGCALGLQRAGFTPYGVAEVDPFCRALLRQNFPTALDMGDVRDIRKQDSHDRISLISGGFPCQDISGANRNGVGLHGLRSSLWFEQLRIIDEFEPDWVIGENVSALRSKGLDDLLRSLAAIGYDAEWHCIPASYLGAWHKRDRIWILAYPNGERRPERCAQGPILRQSDLSRPLTGVAARWPGRSDLPAPRLLGSLDGVPDAAHRLKAIGNSCFTLIPEMIGRALIDHEVFL